LDGQDQPNRQLSIGHRAVVIRIAETPALATKPLQSPLPRALTDESYKGCIARDKTSLDITWVKDKSRADLDNLPDPDVFAGEIEEFRKCAGEFLEIIAQLKK